MTSTASNTTASSVKRSWKKRREVLCSGLPLCSECHQSWMKRGLRSRKAKRTKARSSESGQDRGNNQTYLATLQVDSLARRHNNLVADQGQECPEGFWISPEKETFTTCLGNLFHLDHTGRIATPSPGLPTLLWGAAVNIWSGNKAD